jgi:tetratricopeptide (TPR) repeat protein
VRLLRLVTVLLTLIAACGSARAQAQSKEERARQLFNDGKQAYQANDFQTAYDDFKESYLLSHQPALLYNIASALLGLKRPHEAAEALRAYLRLQPLDPDAPAINQRIQNLEEEQRLLDAERARNAPPPQPSTPASNVLVAAAPPPARARHKTAIIVGVTIAAAVVVGVAVGLGVGLTQHGPEPYTAATFGPMPGTR